MTWTSHRSGEGARFELLTAGETFLRELTGVVQGSGRINLNANATLRAGGSFELDDDGLEIAWGRDRVRVVWETSGEEDIPLGVYVIAAPSVAYTATTRRTRSVELIDKLTIPSEQALTETLTVPAGANVVQAAVDALALTGETGMIVTASDRVLSTPQTWTPGTSILTVVNDLLAIAGYWSLWTDAQGRFQITPYVDPASRPIAYQFAAGATSIHKPDWTLTSELAGVPNRVIVTSREDENGAYLTATAEDMSPDSPTGYPARGRWIDHIEEGVETADQAALNAYTNRRLTEVTGHAESFEQVKHALIPGLWYNQAVTFQSHDITARATVTTMDIPLAVGAEVTAGWRRIS